jgi:hypothetical protein
MTSHGQFCSAARAFPGRLALYVFAGIRLAKEIERTSP